MLLICLLLGLFRSLAVGLGFCRCCLLLLFLFVVAFSVYFTHTHTTELTASNYFIKFHNALVEEGGGVDTGSRDCTREAINFNYQVEV